MSKETELSPVSLATLLFFFVAPSPSPPYSPNGFAKCIRVRFVCCDGKTICLFPSLSMIVGLLLVTNGDHRADPANMPFNPVCANPTWLLSSSLAFFRRRMPSAPMGTCDGDVLNRLDQYDHRPTDSFGNRPRENGNESLPSKTTKTDT